MTPWLMLAVSLSPAIGYRVEVPPGFELLYSPEGEWHATGSVRPVPACAPRGVLKVSNNTIKTWFCWLTPCDHGSTCEQRCWPARTQCEGDRWQPWAETADIIQEPWRWPQERTRLASHPLGAEGVGSSLGGSGSFARSAASPGTVGLGECRP